MTEALPSRRAPWLEAWISLAWVLGDVAVWVVAVLTTIWSRFDFAPSTALRQETLLIAGIAAGVHVLAGLLFGPYLISHLRGSFEEVTALIRAAAISGVVLLGIAALDNDVLFLPRSTPFLATALAITLMLATRMAVRTYRSRVASRNRDAGRVIVFGAGLAGRRLVHNMLHDDASDMIPVGLLDDDRRKRRLRLDGIPVSGGRSEIVALAAKTGATYLAVAVPRATPALIREIQEQADKARLKVKVLPPIDGWLRHEDPQRTDLRDIDLEDLLGRRAVELDQAAIADHIGGRVVLVTGAGGSIGSELCRQIDRFNPARLVLLDRDETGLHSTQLSLTGRGLLEGEDLLLADIRDPQALRSAFQAIRPDVVFHAAALKHLSLLERYPLEAWQTNVVGTANVLRAAAEAGTGTFVNVSTDKAASPTSVLGYSKRVAERLTAEYALQQPGRYVSVRFGNVLGSRGSVIPVFTEQIRRGGPITITHPDVERYFMLIPEAAQLVLQAGAIGRDSEVMVLDMGEPVKIIDVAKTLIQISGKDINVTYTGLRPGEKLTEVLFTNGELHQETSHPLITAVTVPPIATEVAQQTFPSQDHAGRWLSSASAQESRAAAPTATEVQARADL